MHMNGIYYLVNIYLYKKKGRICVEHQLWPHSKSWGGYYRWFWGSKILYLKPETFWHRHVNCIFMTFCIQMVFIHSLLKSEQNFYYIYLFFNPHPRICLWILERERERRGGGERNINWLPSIQVSAELNWQHFGVPDDVPTNWATQPHKLIGTPMCKRPF